MCQATLGDLALRGRGTQGWIHNAQQSVGVIDWVHQLQEQLYLNEAKPKYDFPVETFDNKNKYFSKARTLLRLKPDNIYL